MPDISASAFKADYIKLRSDFYVQIERLKTAIPELRGLEMDGIGDIVRDDNARPCSNQDPKPSDFCRKVIKNDDIFNSLRSHRFEGTLFSYMDGSCVKDGHSYEKKACPEIFRIEAAVRARSDVVWDVFSFDRKLDEFKPRIEQLKDFETFKTNTGASESDYEKQKLKLQSEILSQQSYLQRLKCQISSFLIQKLAC